MSEPKPINVEVSGTIESIEITEITYRMTFKMGDRVLKEETFSRKVNIPIGKVS